MEQEKKQLEGKELVRAKKICELIEQLLQVLEANTKSDFAFFYRDEEGNLSNLNRYAEKNSDVTIKTIAMAGDLIARHANSVLKETIGKKAEKFMQAVRMFYEENESQMPDKIRDAFRKAAENN